ncbi:MAG: FAD-dependent oxidoreductase [Candidatus Cloacimonetes bacterium]|nr:FAD-dependent oxidoreductase [Candidatus Cloacimonadota bacterium]
MSWKDNLSPFYTWKRAFEKPYTTRKPLQDRPGSPRYRGFHKNDLEKCIGCGTCESICQNEAIDLVPVEGIVTSLHDSGLRPKFDYGRCCWCALCVDICTTDSLSMSNEYIWIDPDGDAFRFIPGSDPKSWDSRQDGYQRSNGYGLLNPERETIQTTESETGIKSFLELIKGYSHEEALKEATRCVDCGICVASCPAHMDIPDYIRAIRDNDLEKALKLLYKTNPLPATCGRICTHKCETVCSVGINGDPIAIRWLKRFIIDQFELAEVKEILAEDLAANNKKVAIIGAGPSGLSAAYYLITMGYRVTIYEAEAAAGGMVRWGVPDYRLPIKQLGKDIDYILSLGAEIKYNIKIGHDISFTELSKNFAAIYLSVGLQQPYKLEIPGEDLPGVISGLSLLAQVADGKLPDLGQKVIVIGGGNTAMDAARTARRLQCEVTLLYRRRREDMPADQEEIEDADHESVQIITQAIPVKIEKSDSGLLKFIWNRARMEDQGIGKRPRPVPIENGIEIIEANTIITAVGQGPDFSFLPADIAESIIFKRFKVRTEPSGQTSYSKIFAGGDIVNNTADAISAIADGYNAARGIDKYLQD